MGGLSKKGFEFEKIRKSSTNPVITLDAGALLFKSTRLTLNRVPQEKATAEGIVKAYNMIGYDAVGIGMNELAAGLAFLKELAAQASFSWISSNLVDKSSLQAIFKEHLILSAGSIKVGVIGLTNPQGQSLLAEKHHVKILSWQKSLPSILQSINDKADLIVLLSNLSNADNKEIAQKHPEIQIILQSGVSRSNLRPTPLNNTILTQSEKQGKYVGIMDINWQPSKSWPDMSPKQLIQKNQEFDRLNWQLGKYKKFENPSNDLQIDPAKLRAYKRLIQRKKELQRELDKLQSTINQRQNNTGPPSTFTNRFVAMRIAMPDQKEVLTIVQDINQKIAKLDRQQKTKKVTRNPLYVGFKKCQPCHPKEVSSWSNSKHARSLESLIKNKKQNDLNCLPCHVTSVSLNNPTVALQLPNELKNVGCEVCHGPGKNHSNSPQSNSMISLPQKSVCLSCHTNKRDDTFNYLLDIKLVHP